VTHITGFTVEGLAGHRESVHYELDRNINIFWGVNGSGKTSLLRILHSALADNARLLQKVPFKSARIFIDDDTSGTMVRYIDLTVDARISLDEDEVAAYELRERPAGSDVQWTTVTGKKRISHRHLLPIRHGYLPISRIEDRYMRRAAARYPQEPIDDSWFDSAFASQVKVRWQMYSARALDQINDVQQQGIAGILSILFGGTQGRPRPSVAKEIRPAYKLVTRFLDQQRIPINFSLESFTQRYTDESDMRSIVSRIEEVTDRTERILTPQMKFHNLINQLYTGTKELKLAPTGLKVTVGDESIPLESLSSGEKQLLRILLETLDGGSNPVIIDEPELSMHIDWQRRLVESMRIINPDSQLILATHSPEIMADVPYSQIFEL
jgi:predicted ATP-dependent endonuclease of OLD family